MKTKVSTVDSELKKSTEMIQPLKRENQRLVKENNELHLDMIQVKEGSESKDSKSLSALKKLEGEKSDLRFILSQKDRKINELETEMEDLRARLDDVMTKSVLKKDSLRQPRVELSAPIALSELPGNSGTDMRDLEWAEQMRKADERTSSINRQLDEERTRVRDMKAELEVCQKAVENRETEVKRLSNLYEGGQNIDKLYQDYKEEERLRQIDNMDTQLNFLNEENTKLNGEILG